MNHYMFEELKEGISADFTVKVTAEMQELFTTLSGDENPMHMTDDYARANGYENRLVYGMLTASFYSRLVGMYLPGEHCIFHEADIKFNAPVYVGDELTVFGEVAECDEVFRRIKIKAYIKNQSGKKVSKATLYVGVKA